MVFPAIVVLALLLTAPVPACATPPPGGPAIVPAADVAAQLDQLQGVLQKLDPGTAPSDVESAIRTRLGAERVVIDRLEATSRTTLDGLPALGTLQDLGRQCAERTKVLAEWSRTLTDRAQALQRDAERTRSLRADWRVIAIGMKAQAPPAALMQRVRATLGQLATIEQRTDQRLAAVLELQSLVATEASRVDAVARELRHAYEHILSRLFVRDSPTFVGAWAGNVGLETLGERVAASWRAELASIEAYLRRRAGLLPTWAALLVASVIAARHLRRRSRRWEIPATVGGSARELLEHPLALALVGWLFVTPLPYGGAPPALVRLVMLAYFLPVLRIVGTVAVPAFGPILWGLLGLALLDEVRQLLASTPALERSLLVFECALGTGALLWLPRHLSTSSPAPAPHVLRGIETGRRLALATLVIALLANGLGYVRLAKLLFEGTIRTAGATILAVAVASVLEGFTQLALSTGAAERFRLIVRHRPVIAEGARRLIRVVVGVLWVGWTLRAFSLTDAALGAVRTTLGARLPLGEITFSLGDLVAFAIAVWLSFMISRLLRVVLEDEVFPRMHLGRGVPYAVATFTSYLVLLIGFFVALAAAGFDFDRLAVVAGALGVGIGFGLQNIVNNFVSGLILLVERPVQVGDLVQLGDVIGEVRRIGLRSSVIHTNEGSEMIVPNAHLITERVVNWTLSDRKRRLDLPVGVAYGTDPEEVLRLLLDVARRHGQVLSDPAPQAFFTGFGDSALTFELRAWTTNLEGRFEVRSDLAIGVNRALADAGIRIPFPQRDLHVHAADVDERRG